MKIFLLHNRAYLNVEIAAMLLQIATEGLGKLETIALDSCSMLQMRDEPSCAFEDLPKQSWKDFIQNPARPGRQIKKQKPPKQSFKAQMRSVNCNR